MKHFKSMMAILWSTMALFALSVEAAQPALPSASDFTYKGKYIHPNTGGGYQSGFALRRVNGELRYMVMYPLAPAYNIAEFSLAGKRFDDVISQYTNVWGTPAVMDFGPDRHYNLSWIDSLNRLLVNQSIDYPQAGPAEGYPTNMHFVTLTEGAKDVGDPRKISLEGKIDRLVARIYEVPESWRSLIGGKRFITANDGYSSRMGSFPTSLGLASFALPALESYFPRAPTNPADTEKPGALIAARDFITLSQHDHLNRGVKTHLPYKFIQTGVNDDYLKNWPQNRGMGKAGIPSGVFVPDNPYGLLYVSYTDGGDPRNNPGSDVNPGVGPPDFEPSKGTAPNFNFAYPRGDAVDHWPAGTVMNFGWDQYCGGFLAEIRGKKYFVQALRGFSGRAFYFRSAGQVLDVKDFVELHFFDFDDLTAVVAGKKKAEDIQPTAMVILRETIDDTGSIGPKFAIDYDKVNDDLYIMVNRGASGPSQVRDAYLLTYHLNRGVVTPPPPVITATVKQGLWTLYEGTIIVKPRVDYTTEDACVAAAKALNVARAYTCRTSTAVNVKRLSP